MSHKLTDSELEFIVQRVLQNAKDALEESKISSSDFVDGKKLAYYEILDTIKNELEVRDVDIKPFGLDVMLEDFA